MLQLSTIENLLNLVTVLFHALGNYLRQNEKGYHPFRFSTDLICATFTSTFSGFVNKNLKDLNYQFIMHSDFLILT